MTHLPSGNARLDTVLGGGLPENAIVMLMGLPGSGKTILAQQYAFANATEERPAVYFSTVSEPYDKVVRFVQSFDFFQASAIGLSVFYEDLGQTLSEDGLPGVLERIDRSIREVHPGLLAIDSFKALSPYADDPRAFREFLHGVAGRLTALALTSFWVGEYSIDELATAPEFAVADVILSLQTVHAAAREARFLQVLKARGSHFASGKHAYRISEAGMDVYPRLADVSMIERYDISPIRSSSGVAFLDEMLNDGYFPGSATLVVGPTGIGKTVMGIQFVVEGARRGEPGLIGALQENPSQLERLARGFGWSLDVPGIETLYRSPVGLYIDQWFYELLDAVERTGARRIVIDSLTDLEFAVADELRFQEFVYSLTQRVSRSQLNLLMTFETAELAGVDRVSDFGVSRLASNVLLLEYLPSASELERTITILKTRASDHDLRRRRFAITPAGLVLGPSLTKGPPS